jgi:hypothetical protein
MHGSIAVSALVLAAAGAGAPPLARGPIRAADAVGQRIADEFRKQAAVEFARCETEACVEAAASSCKPSHLARARYTLEGAPAFFDYFAMPVGGSCKVVELADLSEDYWGACRVAKRICPSLAKALAGEAEDGACSRREVLFERRPCSIALEHLFGEAGEPASGATRKPAAPAWGLREAEFRGLSIRAAGGLAGGPVAIMSSQSGNQAGIRMGDYVGREKYRLRSAERIVGGACFGFEAASGRRERICHRGALGDFPFEPPEPPKGLPR